MLFRSDDAEVIRIGTQALRLHASVWVLQAMVIMTNMLYQATGHAMPALVMSMSRQGIFLIPSILILNAWLGLDGVVAAQTVADLLAFVLGIYFAIRYLRHGFFRKNDHLADTKPVSPHTPV